MQGDRTGLVSLLVFVRRVQISLCVAGVIRHPQRHWSSCNGNLKKTKQEVKQKLFFFIIYFSKKSEKQRKVQTEFMFHVMLLIYEAI